MVHSNIQMLYFLQNKPTQHPQHGCQQHSHTEGKIATKHRLHSPQNSLTRAVCNNLASIVPLCRTGEATPITRQTVLF